MIVILGRGGGERSAVGALVGGGGEGIEWDEGDMQGGVDIGRSGGMNDLGGGVCLRMECSDSTAHCWDLYPDRHFLFLSLPPFLSLGLSSPSLFRPPHNPTPTTPWSVNSQVLSMSDNVATYVSLPTQTLLSHTPIAYDPFSLSLSS